VLLRIVLVTAAIAVAMGAIKDGRVLSQAGIVATCSTVTTPVGQSGVWHACKAGKLEGRHDLTRSSCVSQGTARGLEYWRCPVQIESDRAPTA
jgi:hypothetical protein